VDNLISARGILSKAFKYPYSGAPLQVVTWSGDRVAIALSGTSARVALPTGSDLVEIAASENCYIAFGDNTVEATSSIGAVSRLFIAGVQVVPVPTDANGAPLTHIAALQAATGGVLQVERVS
jgi:hypothetical protein